MRCVEAQLTAPTVEVAAESPVRVELRGALKPFQLVPYGQWPSHAKALFRRLHPSISGCAAFAAQMRGTGLLTGCGCATTDAAKEQGLQTKVVWDRTTHRAMAQRVLVELHEAEDGEEVDSLAIVACDAMGATVDVEALAADAWDIAEGSLDAAAPGIDLVGRRAVGSLDAAAPGIDLVGRRVAVHWPADRAWYHGTIALFSRRRGWLVRYDRVPGESDRTEYEDLTTVEWALEAPSPPPPPPQPPALSVPSPPPPPAGPPELMPSCETASLDFVFENPLNALWLLLFTRHPRFERWPSVVLSYCKLRSGATPYRKTTRFLSSLPSARTYRPPCSRNAPCATVQRDGRHKRAIGEVDAERCIIGYYERSHVPASIVGDYLEAIAAQRLTGGVTRLLLLDLCAGRQSARAGIHAFQRRAAWARHRDAGCEIRYVSVDCNAECNPHLCVDLLAMSIDEVLRRAFDTVGWPSASVAVFVWASPPCETYSTLTLGTLAAKCGAQRRGRGDAYAPVGGKRGAKARDADRLAIGIMAYLHRHATR